jgi:hypothetical protein
MEKSLRLLLVGALSIMSFMSLHAQPIPSDSLYLGQTHPGNVPVIFNLPVTAGLRPVERIAITTDGKEIYYGELNTYPPTIQKVQCLRYLNDHWQGPFTIFNGYASPRLTINDSTMYIQSNINDVSTTYYSKRDSTGWSTPIRLINTTQQTHYCQTTALNNTYLSSNLPATPTQRDICRLVISNSDTVIEGLGKPINTLSEENDLFVADDESYLLFSRNSSGAGDMYLSFKKSNGRWTNPKKFGEPINHSGYSWEYGQFVSKDGTYLFYTSGGLYMSSYYTYWVKINNIIDSLHHTNFLPYLDHQIPDLAIHAGELLSYTVPDSIFVDDDGNNTLAYTASLSNGNPLPAWLLFNQSTKTFSGTPTGASTPSVKVTATDSANASVSCTFGISVLITGVREPEGRIPGRMELYQNYPNPFNPTTTIAFAIRKTGRYTLGLYNILGERVREISDREYRPGYYRETLSASGLSSGVYVYRLTADGISIVRQMVLLR